MQELNVATSYIDPGEPWQNGYNESFNGKFRDEFLDVELLDTLKEAKVLIEEWRYHYNMVRPHSSLGYVPPMKKSPTCYYPHSASLHKDNNTGQISTNILN